MSRSGNSKSAAGVTAFPMLAVLLCTIGALALVFIATARHARSSALVAAREQTVSMADEQETAAAARELAELRVQQLREARDKTAAQLEDERLKLSHLEEHTRRLREQLANLKTSEAELQRGAAAGQPQRNAVADELAKLQSQISYAKRELATAEANANHRKASYSVIPYEGPNQTRRRPIYIECQIDSVIIQPDGIVFHRSDFEGPLGPGNPLAATLRAIREQIAAQEAAAGAEKSEPYPLLLVRPEGVEAYYAARTALASWGAEFGYEMIEQDWDLDFPPSDARLTEAARAALAEARERQRQLAAAAPRHYPKNAKPTFHARPRGGFEQQGGPRGKHGRPSGEYSPEQSFAAGRSTRPHATGGNGLDDGAGGGGASAENSSLLGNGGAMEKGTGQSAASGSSSNPYESILTSNGGNDRAGAGSRGGNDDSILGSQSNRGTSRDVSPLTSTGGQQAGASPANGNSEIGMQASAIPGSGSRSSASAGENQAGQSIRSGQGESKQSTASKGNARSGGNGALPHQADVAMLRQNQAKGAQGSGGASDSNGPQSSQTAGAGSAQQTGTSSTNSADASGAPSSGGPAGATPPAVAPDGPPTPTISAQLNKKKPASLAQSRGNDWGLPNASNGSTAVTRPIIVECRTDRLVIQSESGSGAGKTIPIVGDTHGCVDDLVSGVWQHMKSWGIAGRGLYWKPTLVMVVAPGAEHRYAELEALLIDSGMDVKQRAAKPPVADNSKAQRK